MAVFMFQVHELDLSTVVPCCSGPKRPHDRVALSDMKTDFAQCLTNKVGFKVSKQYTAEYHIRMYSTNRIIISPWSHVLCDCSINYQ